MYVNYKKRNLICLLCVLSALKMKEKKIDIALKFLFELNLVNPKESSKESFENFI